MTDALELLTDVQFAAVEVDLFPCEAEDFSPAQAEDEHQDEGGVERFARVPGRFEEPPGVGGTVNLTALSHFRFAP